MVALQESCGRCWPCRKLRSRGKELARGILSYNLGRGSPKAVDNRTSSLAGVSWVSAWDAGRPLCKCQECL